MISGKGLDEICIVLQSSWFWVLKSAKLYCLLKRMYIKKQTGYTYFFWLIYCMCLAERNYTLRAMLTGW
jgi:hypothetical protein